MAIETKVCRVCLNALNGFMSPDGVGYQHTPHDPTDHEPEPIAAPPGWRGRCDFCSGPQPEYRLPVKTFLAPGPDLQESIGAWAACPACAGLIAIGRWNGVTLRALRYAQTMHPETTAADREDFVRRILALYVAIRENITGPLEPLESEETS